MTDPIAHLDFTPTLPCEGCDDPAGYRVRLDCGCRRFLCLFCLKAMELGIKMSQISAVSQGLVPFFDHADCGQRIWCWPLADVQELAC